MRGKRESVRPGRCSGGGCAVRSGAAGGALAAGNSGKAMAAAYDTLVVPIRARVPFHPPGGLSSDGGGPTHAVYPAWIFATPPGPERVSTTGSPPPRVTG